MKAHYSRRADRIDRNNNSLAAYEKNQFIESQMDGIIGVNALGCFEYFEDGLNQENNYWKLLISENFSEKKEFEVVERETSESQPIDYVLEKGIQDDRWKWLSPKISEQIGREDLIRNGVPEDILLDDHVIDRWFERANGKLSTVDAYSALQESQKFELPESMQGIYTTSYGFKPSNHDVVFVQRDGDFKTVLEQSMVENEVRHDEQEIEKILSK